jgi:hypothetical protein
VSIALQFEQRLASLASEVRRLRDSFDQDDSPPTPHRRVLATLAEERLQQAGQASLSERMHLAVRVEELLRFAAELESQYTESNTNVLQVAAFVARECYQQVISAGMQLGANVMLERWPEPAIVLEPMHSPVTYVRSTSAKWLGFAPRGEALLPFPLVLMPPYPLSALSGLCLIHHEIGHNADRDLELTPSLRTAMEARLEQAGASPELINVWLGWAEEIVADAFGTMLAGPAFAIEMDKWAVAYGNDAAPASATHPFPSLRVALANELLRLKGVGGVRASAAPVPQPTTTAARFSAHVSIVARALFEAEIPALGNASILDLAPDMAQEADLVEAAAEALCQRQLAAVEPLPLRLFPSAACVAGLLPYANHAAIGEDLVAVALRPARGASSVPFSHERYRTATLRSAVPSILDEERDGLKLPPPGLFRDVRNVSFVGATNDGLPALFDKHTGPRKQSVEVFFLSVNALRGLECPDRELRRVLELGRLGRAGLTPQLLNRLAERWTLYEHDEPFVFASHWDADAPGGRIHASAHGWGQDIKRAPSHDYTWPRSALAPERSYRFFQQALVALRGRARKIGSSA